MANRGQILPGGALLRIRPFISALIAAGEGVGEQNVRSWLLTGFAGIGWAIEEECAAGCRTQPAGRRRPPTELPIVKVSGSAKGVEIGGGGVGGTIATGLGRGLGPSDEALEEMLTDRGDWLPVRRNV